jgi:hypothetical protein
MIRRTLTLFGLTILAGLSATPARASLYFEPLSFRLEFGPDAWEACSLLLHDQVRAADAEGQRITFQWFDFSPLEFPVGSGPGPTRGVSRPETVDVQYIGASMEPVRFYQRNNADPKISYFEQALGRRYVIYEDMLAHLSLTKSPGLRAGFTQAERKLPLERTELGLVELHQPGLVDGLAGSIRIFDATKSHYRSPPASPAELMYEERQMSAWSIQDLREADPDVELYEVGNWLLAEETRSNVKVSLRVRLRTKYMLLKMLLEKVVKRSIKADPAKSAKYLFHVATIKHARSYSLDYDGEVIQEDPIPGSDEKEALLLVSAEKFAIKLQKQIDRLAVYLGGYR